MNITFRPIERWPQQRTENPKRSQFKAGYENTLDILEHELWMLDSQSVVIQLDLQEADLRLDGMPRKHAKPTSQGVIVAFDSRYGPLKYATDAFDAWHDNLRAIALGLEALRKVDRYGITKRGEQYTGWKPPRAMTAEEAVRMLKESGDYHGPLLDAGAIRTAFHRGAKNMHPDAGGDPRRFRMLTEARDLLLQEKGEG